MTSNILKNRPSQHMSTSTCLVNSPMYIPEIIFSKVCFPGFNEPLSTAASHLVRMKSSSLLSPKALRLLLFFKIKPQVWHFHAYSLGKNYSPPFGVNNHMFGTISVLYCLDGISVFQVTSICPSSNDQTNATFLFLPST